MFHDTVKYLYNQFRHTPNMVYLVFLIEIAVVLSYILFPMIYKFIYTDIKDVKDHKILLEKEIEGIRTEKYFIEREIKKKEKKIIKMNDKLKKNNLNEIKQKGYDLSNAEEDLRNYLINLEITDKVKQNNLVKEIQKVVPKIKSLEYRLVNNSEKLKEMEKFKKGSKEVKATVLLRKPIYLEKETKIFVKPNSEDEYYQYNYNFAINSWVFLRANQSPLNEYKNILKFNGNSTISYNVQQ